ncbi:M12 family metallopeptidase [Caballeronia jiangsuensis]|uniref:M12 family metallopeptidase n=1 Tax=Caballeronia jiangsuensis TaxID=1458357 RepID=A0ABW9CY20_9BURK
MLQILSPRVHHVACLAFVVGFLYPEFSQAQAARDIDFVKIDSTLVNYGYVSKQHLWQSSIVNVCWENADSKNEAGRIEVEKAVESSWQKVSNINFTGWLQCQKDTKGVRIRINDDTSQPTSLIGTRLDGVHNGMQLNLTFTNWSHTECEKRVSECIKIESMHEFGHALGLAHENLREDAPKACKERYNKDGRDTPPADASTEGTPYDANSVMNYCHMIYHSEAKLSDNDAKTASILYGARN